MSARFDFQSRTFAIWFPLLYSLSFIVAFLFSGGQILAVWQVYVAFLLLLPIYIWLRRLRQKRGRSNLLQIAILLTTLLMLVWLVILTVGIVLTLIK